MTSHSLFPKLLPWLFFIGLALLSTLLHFNGLYGQDAHEYLRQSRVIFERLQGVPVPPPVIGDLEFAGGYPLAGAILRWLTGDAILALQCVSWLSAAVSLWIFERLLALLTPGARMESRWCFIGLGLVLAPLFVRAGFTCMSDSLGLMLLLAAFFFGLRSFENSRVHDAVWAMGFAALAFTSRYALAALLLPLCLCMLENLRSRRRWLTLVLSIFAFIIALLPHFWLKANGTENPLAHSSLAQWSALNFFKNTFVHPNTGLSAYLLPNALFVMFPLAHPAFCLVLPGLFFLFKRTDLVLSVKKILLLSILGYLVLLGGMPHQNLRHLLPAYILMLLLLFPAWDRLYCYGFLFFPRLTGWILATALALQLVFCTYYLTPVLARNKLEREVAGEMLAYLPAGATVYAFDLDVALRSYLPGVRFQNLWEQRYAHFDKGSYVLFKEELRKQWAGQNPVLNWDDLRANDHLRLCKVLPGDWMLWEIQ